MTHRFTLRLLALCALAGPGAAQTAPQIDDARFAELALR